MFGITLFHFRHMQSFLSVALSIGYFHLTILSNPSAISLWSPFSADVSPLLHLPHLSSLLLLFPLPLCFSSSPFLLACWDNLFHQLFTRFASVLRCSGALLFLLAFPKQSFFFIPMFIFRGTYGHVSKIPYIYAVIHRHLSHCYPPPYPHYVRFPYSPLRS